MPRYPTNACLVCPRTPALRDGERGDQLRGAAGGPPGVSKEAGTAGVTVSGRASRVDAGQPEGCGGSRLAVPTPTAVMA